ncbi:hypothetical protein D3C73_1644580 [compost metagenome]
MLREHHGATERWRKLGNVARYTVVGKLGDDDAGTACVLLGDPKREVIRFTPGTREHDSIQVSRECA